MDEGLARRGEIVLVEYQYVWTGGYWRNFTW